MNLTLQILRTIFSSSADHSELVFSDTDKLEYYRYSVKNRISLLFLDSLDKNHQIGTLEPTYEEEKEAYVKTINLIARCSKSLLDANINHAFFKTLRPYRSTTVDIDILIFGNDTQYMKASRALQEVGFKFVVRGPRSTTLVDPELHIGIDLYEEIAVSSMIYVNKERLMKLVRIINLPNQKRIKTLIPEADLATVIAHSLIKEQMYPLSEYCTFMYYLDKMNVKNFIDIIQQNNLTNAARTHATITSMLYEALNQKSHANLRQVLECLGDNSLERRMFLLNDFKTPYKYSLLTVARSFLEIMKEPKCRTSLTTQILRTLNPNFAKDFLRKLTDHVVRETY